MSQKNKHIPQRTCIACRQARDKRDLVRLVRIGGGAVVVDLSAKKPGRGAYLCPRKACWGIGLKGNRLEHVLRTKLGVDNRRNLMDFGDSLPGGD